MLSFGQYWNVQVENDNRFHSVAVTAEQPTTPVDQRTRPRIHPVLRSLSDVPLNRWFRIERLDGPREECRRLLDLGFTPGEEVIVTHTAPLGDPLVVRVRGALLALRKREAAWIVVR